MSQDARVGGAPGVAVRRVLELLASLVRLVAGVLAGILVVHIVLTVAGANPQNPITVFFAGAANGLTLGLADLFLPADPRIAVLVNYGLAAVVWLVLGLVVARVILAVARLAR